MVPVLPLCPVCGKDFGLLFKRTSELLYELEESILFANLIAKQG